MNAKLARAALALLGLGASCAALAQPGDSTVTIEHGGLSRMYRLHVPAKYDAARPAPLLVALHGGGGNMDIQANDSYYGLLSKSEAEGFIAVFPNGYSRWRSGKLATWNAGGCCAGARDRNVDDVGFIRRVVEDVARRVNVDHRRIYATGMSNGAMMAYRLACEAGDMFRAVAPVAGTDNTRGCSPSRPVAVLHIHAANDSHVLFEGGAGPDAAPLQQITSFVSVPSTMAKWARQNGCEAAPQRVLERAGAWCEAYPSCRGAPVQLCVTATGGHSWPGGTKPLGGSPPSQAISANDAMWEFFNRLR